MKKLRISTVVFVLVLAGAAPVVALAADHSGSAYGQHHAAHARARGGFTGTMNPGVVHRGYSGWHEHMGPMHE